MKTWTQHRRECKYSARRNLPGNFLKPVIAEIICFALTMFCLSFLPLRIPQIPSEGIAPEELLAAMLPEHFTADIIALFVITFLLLLLIISPLRIGISRYYLLASRGEKPKFSVVFSSFFSLKVVFASCAHTIIITVVQGFWTFVFTFFPSFILTLSAVLGPFAYVLGILIYIAAIIFFMITVAPLTISQFVFAENYPHLSALKCVMLTFKRARGARRELLVFRLSFIFWYLIFGTNVFGQFFIAPYINMATATFSDTIDECK